MVDVIAIILALSTSLLGALAAFFIKKGSSQLNSFSVWKMLRIKDLWLAAFLYVVSVVPYIIALGREELSVVFPILSITYLWTTLFSVKFLNEKMSTHKWLGLFGIVVGVVLIGFGS